MEYGKKMHLHCIVYFYRNLRNCRLLLYLQFYIYPSIYDIFNLVNSVICFAKNGCEFSIIASIIYVFMIVHNLFILAFNYSISSGGFHSI